MPGLPEVALELAPAAVRSAAADLAAELLVEPVELEEPVGDGLAVPAERELERVVDVLVVLVRVEGGVVVGCRCCRGSSGCWCCSEGAKLAASAAAVQGLALLRVGEGLLVGPRRLLLDAGPGLLPGSRQGPGQEGGDLELEEGGRAGRGLDALRLFRRRRR